MSVYSAIPVESAIAVPADPRTKAAQGLPKLKIGMDFLRWLGGLKSVVDSQPTRKASVSAAGQTALIAATPLPVTDVSQGVWRISLTYRVTTPASGSSAVQGTITWTERGVVQSQSGANLLGNLTTSREGITVIARTDGATPISYAFSYTSVGTPMQYSVDIVAEELAPDAV